MNRRMAYRLLACLLGLLVTASARAEEAPDLLVQRVTEEVLAIIRGDRDIQNGDSTKAVELINAKILPHFNFPHMTALAVGRDWRRATPAQQQRLSAEFQTLLVRTYANALGGYRKQKILYRPLRVAPGATDVLVETAIDQPGSQRITVDYAMERVDGEWKVYDVSVAKISLVTNYRSQFSSEVSSGGIDGLIASLATKNRSQRGSTIASKDR